MCECEKMHIDFRCPICKSQLEGVYEKRCKRCDYSVFLTPKGIDFRGNTTIAIRMDLTKQFKHKGFGVHRSHFAQTERTSQHEGVSTYEKRYRMSGE